VADGDTLVVRTKDSEEIKVRLYGIDAPESEQKHGPEAAEALKRLVHGKPVKVVHMDAGQDDWTAGLVEHEGNSINLEMVNQGYAWHYEEGCEEQPICDRIKAAEQEARTGTRGIWDGEPVAPWDRRGD
jgi:endonuclease YncB( thermonuclease family)